MNYIVGLGNPGEKYQNTRHSIGFIAVKHFVEELGLPSFILSSKCCGRISEGVIDGNEVMLLLPETFMNNSGGAVKKIVKPEDSNCLTVVYDDVDLPIGEIKVSVGRGSGGHNGVQSIINALGTKEFSRVRIGVASRGFFGGVKRPSGDRLAKHVLGTFSKGEEKLLEDSLSKTSFALQSIIKNGVELTMNKMNERV